MLETKTQLKICQKVNIYIYTLNSRTHSSAVKDVVWNERDNEKIKNFWSEFKKNH